MLKTATEESLSHVYKPLRSAFPGSQPPPEPGADSIVPPLIVFDFDGTLVDSYGIKRESYWQAVAAVLGLGPEARPVVDASYARTSGAHRFEQFADTAAALDRTVTDEQREAFSQLYSRHNEDAKGRMREFPSVRAVLAALRPQYDLALVSGLPHDLLVADAGARGLDRYFAEIEGGDKGQALDRFRAAGRRIHLFVGDTSFDEAVAAARGIPFYRVQGDDDLRRVPPVAATVPVEPTVP